MRIRLIATVLSALALTACTDTVWQKPIALSPRVQLAYDYYTNLPNPEQFAVSEDGQHFGMTYCPAESSSGCVTRGTTTQAIRLCENSSGGVECKIYAIGVSKVYTGQ